LLLISDFKFSFALSSFIPFPPLFVFSIEQSPLLPDDLKVRKGLIGLPTLMRLVMVLAPVVFGGNSSGESSFSSFSPSANEVVEAPPGFVLFVRKMRQIVRLPI